MTAICANNEYEKSLVPYVPDESEVNFNDHKSNGTANQSPKSQSFNDYDFKSRYPNFNDVLKRIESVCSRNDTLNKQSETTDGSTIQQSEITADMISMYNFLLIITILK